MYGLAKFWAAAGAAKATTRATAIMSFFMGVSFQEGRDRKLVTERGCVGVREVLSHSRSGEGDNQGDGDQKLLHLRSPLACQLALGVQGSGRMAMGVRSERSISRAGHPRLPNTLSLSIECIGCTE
jgi:hypothetical protein